jgi:putative ABC transport system permease protein
MRRTTVLRSQLIDAVRHPARMALMGVAITIASFVVFGTVLASRISERTILDQLSGTPAAVDFVISPATLDTLEAVRAAAGVTEVAIRTDTFQLLADQPHEGLNIRADPGAGPLAMVTVLDGRFPRADFEIAITERTVSRMAARRGGNGDADGRRRGRGARGLRRRRLRHARLRRPHRRLRHAATHRHNDNH